MGKRSVKKDKNEYQLSRESAGLTREKASEAIGFMSDDRIEKIESGRFDPHPDEVLAMAEHYRHPRLINYYCATQCPIGKVHVPLLESKDLRQITLELLADMNSLEQEKNRLIEIARDGRINPDEQSDFQLIRLKLRRLREAVSSMELWVEEQEAGLWQQET